MQFIKAYFIKYEESIVKTLFTSFIIFIIYAGLIVSSRYFGLNFVFFTPAVQNNTGAVISGELISTGVINTGSIDIGAFTRENYLKNLSGTGLDTVELKVNYVLSFGESGNDFTTVIPHVQDIVLGATKSSNNILIQSYVQKYKTAFVLDNTRIGFLVIKTKKRVPDAKDMILAINGIRLGSFHKNADSNKFKSDISDNYLDNLYIFPLSNIDIAQYGALVDLSKYAPLNITVVVGENNNTVEELSIVYIN